MAFNARRGGVGTRRAPMTNNFVPGGQLLQPNRPVRPQGAAHPNPNFRPQQQRMSTPNQPQFQPIKHQPATKPASPAPQKTPQVQPPQTQPPPIKPPQTQQPPPLIEKIKIDEETIAEQQAPKKVWSNKGKISKKERNRRKNMRLSKLLQPKNAVMILNELVKSVTYSVMDSHHPTGVIYTASVIIEGVTHQGQGRSKMEAKSMAAESALKSVIKSRNFTLNTGIKETEEPMETDEDSVMPWQHFASFALYKLFQSWGEEFKSVPDEVKPVVNIGHKPSKKMPENAVHMNPVMLINQMLPQVQFEDVSKTGVAQAAIFTVKCTVDDQTFLGQGSSKKAARKMAGFAVCNKILGIQYPTEIYTPQE